MSGYLHILYSPKAEGCPRLALDLLEQEHEQLHRTGTVAFVTNTPGDLLHEFQCAAARVTVLGWKRWRYDLLFQAGLRLLRDSRPSGVICYTVGMHVPLAAAARILGIPFLLHVGNAPPVHDSVALRKIRLQMKVGQPFVSGYAACSDHIGRLIRKGYGLPARQIVPIPNGISIDRYYDLRKDRCHRSPEQPIRIGMVGSLEAHKDQTVLLDALACLIKLGVSATLRLVGAGYRETELRKIAARLGISQRVSWMGSVADVRPELLAMDVFGFAVTESEGLGIALIEAMASGLPVVASNVGACQEVLERGRWGRLVEGRDPHQWAVALSEPMALPLPDLAMFQRYDIRETFRSYARLLSAPLSRR